MRIHGNNLSVVIDGRTIISDETVECAPGTMTALTGPSGSGKTTLLHTLGLLLPANAGTIIAGERDVTALNPRQRRRFWRDHAAFILQDYGIIDDDTVAFNVTMRTSYRRTDPTMLAALERTGLLGRESDIASHLSGGEKQRLALARAIYRQANVLYVDEPTASLDAKNRDHVIALLADFAHMGSTVIASTHDPALVEACDVRHVMNTHAIEEVAALGHSPLHSAKG